MSACDGDDNRTCTSSFIAAISEVEMKVVYRAVSESGGRCGVSVGWREEEEDEVEVGDDDVEEEKENEPKVEEKMDPGEKREEGKGVLGIIGREGSEVPPLNNPLNHPTLDRLFRTRDRVTVGLGRMSPSNPVPVKAFVRLL